MSRIFFDNSNLQRHISRAHLYNCHMCNEHFSTHGRVREHMAHDHSGHVCNYCSDMFTSSDELDGHVSSVHNTGHVVCDGCGERFDNMNSLHRHQSQHSTVHLGACSTHEEPSQRQFRLTRNVLHSRARPWIQDANNIMVYGGGPYKPRIEDRVRELQGPQTRSCARQQTERETQEQLIERLRRMYMENLHHFVSHTQRDEQGRIVTISANLLENIPFMDQVLAFLTDVFYICRDRQPYKIVIQFGLLLYKLDTDEYRIWYINKHVNADHRYGMADITTMPNTWRIDNYVDEQRVMNDMLHTNFWRIINAEFHAYNYIVVRPTNIRATIFPTNIYDNMDNQHLGRRRLL